MHILFIADGDDKYGASHSMKQLIGTLLEKYEDIEISIVLPPRVKLEIYYQQLGCKTYRIFYEPFYQAIPAQKWKIPFKFVIRGMEYLLGRWSAVNCLNKKLDMSTVDIIHSNSSREDFGALLALKYHKPLIWHIREFGDKDYKCFSFRSNYIELMNKAANEFIAVSDAVREHWTKKGLYKNRICNIYDGVIEEIVVKQDYRKNPNNSMKLIILGSVIEGKGQYQIIEAINLMTDEEREKITLYIIGGGNRSYINKLNNMVMNYGLSSSVHFLGYQQEASNNISKYDCGLMCSNSEAFGRATIEYMMAGLPVIASDTGANKELVIDGENGLLYQYYNIQDLKNKIVYLLNNANELERMGRAARDYAFSNFSIKLHAERVYSEYLKILG